MSATPPLPPDAGGAPRPAPDLASAMGDPAQVPGTRAYVERRFGPQAELVDRILPRLVDDAIGVAVLVVPLVLGAIMLAVAAPDQTYCLTDSDYSCSVPGTGDSVLLALGLLVMLLGTLLALAFELWNQAYRVSRTGQSLGRQLFGLRVVDARTGGRLTFGRALLKALVSSFAGLISAVWMLFDDEGRTLSDKVADAAVLRRR